MVVNKQWLGIAGRGCCWVACLGGTQLIHSALCVPDIGVERPLFGEYPMSIRRKAQQ